MDNSLVDSMDYLVRSVEVDADSNQNDVRIINASESDPLLDNWKKEKPLQDSTKMESNDLRPSRKLIVDLLIILFGISSWAGVNFTYNELPVLVDALPEYWTLPSYITVIVQIANLGPILYSCLKKWCQIPDKYFIYLLILIGASSALLMSFFYNQTSIIFGAEHSTALLTLTFFKALVGCTSSVLFLPYISRYLELYLISYLIGEGLSGLLGSVVALSQGIGETICVNQTSSQVPGKFSIQIYFSIEFGILVLSFVSFYLLNNLRVCKSQLNDNFLLNLPERKNLEKIEYTQIFRSKFKWLGLFMGLICLFGNGVLPSIQSFSALPYGNQTYHYVVALTCIANPIACFAAYFLPKTSFKALAGLTIIWIIAALYVFTLAIQSPYPVFAGTMFGSVFTVLVWVIYMSVLSYLKLSVTLIFRSKATKELGNSAMFWCGAFGQGGSSIGAVIMFFVINVWKVFESYQQCP